jgi:TonB family protein
MKTQLFALSAAASLFGAATAGAAPSEMERYQHQANSTAQLLLRHTGVDLGGRWVSIRATVAPDGRLESIEVVHSSGSPKIDMAVKGVLRKIVVSNPPLGLTDGAVLLNVRGAAIEQAGPAGEAGGRVTCFKPAAARVSPRGPAA